MIRRICQLKLFGSRPLRVRRAALRAQNGAFCAKKQMLSPAMLGLVVENRYDGVLKKQHGILHSTKREGTGIGLVSAETVVHKYNGSLHLEIEEHIFRVNVLLNL